MAEKIATRAAYGKALAALAEQEPNLVVLDADLSGSTMTKEFGKAHPDRFFDMGIAEANMVGVAAGLAACGKKPFVNSFAMFAAGRAWEQVRNSVAYPGLNVKVVGSHGGLSVGEDGATHQCIEDLAIMRSIPGLTVLCPCDGNEMEQAVKALLAYDGPAYMRLGRLAVENVTDSLPGYHFEIGKGVQLRDGDDITVVAVGMMVQEALKAADILAEEGISVRVIDMHTVKPLDEEILLKAARETGCIVTSEEANVIGGLGSAVSEYLASVCPVPVIRHGVEDEFGRSGEAKKVLAAYGLTAEGIAEKVRAGITLKQALTL
jgi:transketolase